MFIKLNWTITWGIYSLIFLNKINLSAILCNMLKDVYPFSDRPEMWPQVPYSFSCVTVLLYKNDNGLNTDSLFNFILYVRCRSFTPCTLPRCTLRKDLIDGTLRRQAKLPNWIPLPGKSQIQAFCPIPRPSSLPLSTSFYSFVFTPACQISI